MRRKKPPIDHERLYTIKWICMELCICDDTVRKYTRLGLITRIEISSREIYYKGTEVEKLYNIITNNIDNP